MEIFWETIASYNAATWPIQILFTIIAITLTTLLYFRPSKIVRTAMKIFMALLNFWIAGVYYMIYCEPREYNGMLALFWAIMGFIWVYDLMIKHASLERTGNHTIFALILFFMPLIYPLFSLILGRSFPMMTSPVMPCSVAIFTIGLMLAFSEQVNIVLAMFLCHWALIGLSKVYFYGIPEDFVLAFTVVPALYVFFHEYIHEKASGQSKPSIKVLHSLLFILCSMIGVFVMVTMWYQFDLFRNIL